VRGVSVEAHHGGAALSMVRDGVKRSLYEIKTIVAKYPRLAIPIARRRHGVPTGKDTEIVIEGFPRSGTSFAVAAFAMAQPRRIRVACHVHAPAQVTAAVSAGIPALVIVREPEETVLSFVVRNPHISVGQALRGYLRFYATLLPYRHGFVVGTFPDVVTDFGAVIRRVNERFATSFAEFQHTEANVRASFEAIDEDYRGRVGSSQELERIVARPSEVRDEMKARVRSTYREEGVARLRSKAEETYRSLVSQEGGNRR
jgi:hypothetical protein